MFVFAVSSHMSAWAHTDVSPQEAKIMIDTNDQLLVVDVRGPSEYCDENPTPPTPPGHIPGALNYPWGSGVLQGYQELPADGEILLVCRRGNRSNAAAEFLDTMGFFHVYDMTGGMNDWLWDTVLCVDSDGDALNDDLDNCPFTPNSQTLGTCSAGATNAGTSCTSDSQCHGTCRAEAFCSMGQEDTDSDGYGDVCDNCPENCNPNQLDADNDGLGDVCDSDPGCGRCGPACDAECFP